MGEAGCSSRFCPLVDPEMRLVCGEGHFGREQDPLGLRLYLRATLEGTQTWLVELAAAGEGKLSREGWPEQWQIGGGEVEDGSRDGDCKPLLESWCAPFDLFRGGSFVPSCWHLVDSDKGCEGWCLGAAWLGNTSGGVGEKLLPTVWKTWLPPAMMTWKTLNNEGRGRLKIDLREGWEIGEMGRKWAGWRLVLIGEGGQVGQDQSWWMWEQMVVLGGAVELVADLSCLMFWKGGGEESLACKEKL